MYHELKSNGVSHCRSSHHTTFSAAMITMFNVFFKLFSLKMKSFNADSKFVDEREAQTENTKLFLQTEAAPEQKPNGNFYNDNIPHGPCR